MALSFLIILVQLIALVSCESIIEKLSAANVPEEGRMNFTELSLHCGLHTEELEITTEDGYKLKVYHIAGKKKPVLLLHGIGDTSNTWVLRENKSLVKILAEEGYDIWVGNIRGNRYGRKHAHLNPNKDAEFWDFSFHDVGLFDIPAMIDVVLEKTGEKKVSYIGHSQGTTAFFVLTSMKPEYNEKVEIMIGLAPVAFLDNTGPVLKALALAGPVFLPALALLGINELLADHNAEKMLLEFICSQGLVGEKICEYAALATISGYNPDGVEPEFIPVLFSQYPAGISRKALEHYDQIILRKRFSQYDYGPLRNLRVYGQTAPPDYDLSKISTKVALLYSENDVLSTVKDVKRLVKLLPNLVYDKIIDKKEWTHVDFCWSREMDKYLFGHILKLLGSSEL